MITIDSSSTDSLIVSLFFDHAISLWVDIENHIADSWNAEVALRDVGIAPDRYDIIDGSTGDAWSYVTVALKYDEDLVMIKLAFDEYKENDNVSTYGY